MQTYQKNNLKILFWITLSLLLLSAIAVVKAAGIKITTNTLGEGQVSITPDQPEYTEGEEVTLLATGDPGWRFSEWQINYSGWWDNAWQYRLPFTVQALGYERVDGIAELDINFSDILLESGQYGALSLNSLRVVEVDGDGNILDTAVPFQFDQAGDFEATTNAWGTLVIQLTNMTPADAARSYYVYFDINSDFFPAPTFSSQLSVTNTIDEGQDSFQINSVAATYFFQKTAGGFSSLLDSAGNDWIGFNPYPDSGGAGEFRGIPNLLPPEDGGFFHPGNTNAISYLGKQGPLKATINSTIPNTNWATRWEFYPHYATMTVTGIEATPYWFLYEGTPGGSFDVDEDFIMRSDGTQTPANTAWSGDLVSDEWVYFGDPQAGRSLFITNSPGDEHTDSYFPQGNLMTVFGFGRNNYDAYLQSDGQQFTIGLVDEAALTPVTQAINSASQPLNIELGTLQFQQTAVSQNNPTTHTINGHTNVTAVFEAEQYTVETTVSGQGIITTTPVQDTYLYGDEVIITATAVSGWVFSGWQGDLNGHENPAELLVSGNHTINAHFSPNQAPVIETIPSQTIKPSENFTFTITATDPNGTIPTLMALDLIRDMEFIDNGDGTAVFEWTPTSAAIGQHQIVIVTDDGELSTQQTITINVVPHQILLPALFIDS